MKAQSIAEIYDTYGGDVDIEAVKPLTKKQKAAYPIHFPVGTKMVLFDRTETFGMYVILQTRPDGYVEPIPVGHGSQEIKRWKVVGDEKELMVKKIGQSLRKAIREGKHEKT